MLKICVLSPSFSKNPVLRKELQRMDIEVKFNDTGKRLKDNDLIAFIKDCDICIVGLEKIDKNIIDKTNIKMISKFGVGLDNIDIDYCREKGIEIGWTGGVNKRSVAEETLAFMIMLRRNLYNSDRMLKEGVWEKDGGFLLSKSKVGIIGVGNIGKEVIKLLQPFGCEIYGNDIEDREDFYKMYNVKNSEKEYIFKNCDIISLHVPLTNETKHMINKHTLFMMKDSAFIINTSRGSVVKEEDLIWALKNGIIKGAAIDVYEKEPPINSELLKLPSVITTPHIGGNAYESVIDMGMSAINHIKEYMERVYV